MMANTDIELGNHILIALGDRPTALDLVRAVALRLPSPSQIQVTLMHYLMPIYWEHGGDERGRALQERVQEERQVEVEEEAEEERVEALFQQAQAMLEWAGVPAANIRTALAWEAVDTAHAVLDELRRGDYTAVVVGEHDEDILSRLFDPPLAEVLKRHARGTTVWAVRLAENQTVTTARSQ